MCYATHFKCQEFINFHILFRVITEYNILHYNSSCYDGYAVSSVSQASARRHVCR
jgi:hypothetical protein